MNRRRFLAAAGAAPGTLGLAACTAPEPPAMPPTTPAAIPPAPGRQVARATALPGDPRPMRHWLFLPRGYDADPARAWPVLFFLHGSGERGDELDRVKVHGPPKFLDARPDFPFIVVSPQLEADQAWQPRRLHALLAALRATLRIDAARMACTGLSLGGMGTWAWAIEHPGELAAIAPVCGGADPARVCAIGALPVWAFHGEADDVVPVQAQQACIAALRACGQAPRFTVYPGVGHDSWTPAYAEPALFDWLLAQRRGA